MFNLDLKMAIIISHLRTQNVWSGNKVIGGNIVVSHEEYTKIGTRILEVPIFLLTATSCTDTDDRFFVSSLVSTYFWQWQGNCQNEAQNYRFKLFMKNEPILCAPCPVTPDISGKYAWAHLFLF